MLPQHTRAEELLADAAGERTLPDPPPRLVAVVIPAYNEARHIGDVVRAVACLALPDGLTSTIIVVDDGSADDTAAHARAAGARTVRHAVNLGKGAALTTGCQAAVRLGAALIVMLDGDGQHPPEHVPAMLEQLIARNLDVVFGVREGGDRMPLVRLLGNQLLTAVAHALFRLRLRDLCCGFRAFRADCLPAIAWNRSDYSGEIEMALRARQERLAYGEYVIPTIYHDAFKGATIAHGVKLLWQMLGWRLTL